MNLEISYQGLTKMEFFLTLLSNASTYLESQSPEVSVVAKVHYLQTISFFGCQSFPNQLPHD
jgi:hypothetical protein